MVGFLGAQHLMSGSGLGINAEEHDVVILKDGSVIMGYDQFNGLMHFHRYNPATGETEFLSSTGSIGSGDTDSTLIARDDGGFSVVLATGSTSIIIRDYDKNAALTATETLATGFVASPNAIKTDLGYFVTYRDRHNTDGIEYKGAFYNNNNVLLKTYDFDEGRTLSPFPRAEPQSTVLSNGNIATVWRLSDSDGTFVQIFKPNGAEVGDRIRISAPGSQNEFLLTPEITNDPDGGFVVLLNRSASPLDLSIQRYSNFGAKIGKEITFDTSLDQPFPYVGKPQIGFTKAGLMVVAWTSADLSGDTRYGDVFTALFSKSGNLIAGPLLANDSAPDGQSDVDLINLQNGNLLLSFHDDTNVLWSYQASIQARLVLDPDSVWEGNRLANSKNGTAGDDVMLGLGGNDKLSGLGGEDYIKGGAGNDTLSGGNRSDVLEGEAGTDILDGGAGNDQLFGGTGDDTLRGGVGNDQMFGNDGDDTLIGGGGNDVMNGGDGIDILLGGGGNDTMTDTAGNNRFKGGGGDDHMSGGAGIDVMFGQAGNDEIDGGAGRDRLYGGVGFDTLRGGDENDLLKGDSGDDNLNGGKGNDREFGGTGNDRLYSSSGNDWQWGGADADRFVFLDTSFGKDVIKDFEFGVDVLDMSITARAMEFNGQGDITVTEFSGGVRFKVDADNWVVVQGAHLSDFGPNDLILDSPF
ncbi:calcium-binding protein [Seohaeicola nanhaiensis]|uniref:Calcium-binding protein n=1 Tax=Seohaeicola nanhaiensis TaxID=1387282 RepID=A0ABV9KE88_9RHOB